MRGKTIHPSLHNFFSLLILSATLLLAQIASGQHKPITGSPKLSDPVWTQYNPMDYGLAGVIVNSVYFDPNTKTILCGGLGLLKIDSDGSVHSYGPQNSGTEPSNFPPASNAYSCYTDGDTLYAGVFNYNGLFVQIGNASWSEVFSTAINIGALAKDCHGNLWVSANGDGVYVRKGGITLHHYDSTNSGLPKNSIQDFYEDTSGNMWMPVWGAGIAKFDGTNWTIYNSTNTGLGNNFFNYITSVEIDQHGILWTGGLNFNKFDILNNQWTEIPKPTFMITPVQKRINAIDIDQFGNIWAGSDNGLAFYNPYLDVWSQIDGGTFGFDGHTLGLAIMSDTTDLDTLKVTFGGNKLFVIKQSTADYLPQFPANCHIDGEDSVCYGYTYQYVLSAHALSASEYVWSYTGTGVSLTPHGDTLEITYNTGATLGDVECKIRNNFTNNNNDTLQKILTIKNICDNAGMADITNLVHPLIIPNPAKETIHVLGMSGKEITQAQIISTLGQTMANIALQAGKEIFLPVAQLPAGQYMLLLHTAKGKTYTTKFIKE